MGWEELLASLVGSLAWPLTIIVIVCIIWFSAPAEVRKDLLRRLRKAGPSGVELDAASQQITAASHSTAQGALTWTGVARGSNREIAPVPPAQDGPEEKDTKMLLDTQRLIDAAAKWGWVAAGREPNDFPHPLVTWTKDGAKIIGSRVGLTAGDAITFAAGSFIDPDTGKPNRKAHTILWQDSHDLTASAEPGSSGSSGSAGPE
jgi:hypothetical protein